MKLLQCLPLLSGAATAAALAQQPVCKAEWSSKLSACGTATAFCSKLLGTATSTLTYYTHATNVTSLTTTKTDGRTSYVTATYYLATVTTTSTSTTTVATATVTAPSGVTGVATCYIQTISDGSPGVSASSALGAVKAKVTGSCGWNAAHSMIASKACGCLLDARTTATLTNYKTVYVKGTPTVTITHYQHLTSTKVSIVTSAPTTSTVTLPPCPTQDTSCNNAGLQWAYYTALNGNGYPSNSLNFDPTLYKNATPIINGTTNMIDIPSTGGSGTGLFYGKGPEPESSFFVNHRGYFYVPQTGNYSVTYDYVDDAAYTYIGDYAYSGWNITNRNLYANWGSAANPTVMVMLTKGEYVPIRVAYGQGGGAGGLGMDIYAPDGEKVMSDLNGLTGSPYFVSFSCDGTAPAYPAWGQET